MTAALKDATCATAEQALKDFKDALLAAKLDCDAILDRLPQSRAAAIARTNLETGFLWLDQAGREFGA
jgi:uncharacterized membrane protein